MKKILTPFIKGNFKLKNHLVMAPMTRCRAIGNIPNDLMAEYYAQRAGAGLIITEATSPSPEGLGYPRIPGIFNEAQIDGWKKTTSAVHARGSRIFLQLMHTGRIGNNENLPKGVKLVGVSDKKADGQIWTDASGMQDYSAPIALTTEGVTNIIDDFVKAAKNAISAGFDGVELHSANGYLFEQFLNPHINTRTDQYGGSVVNRARVIIELCEKLVIAIGKEKIGIRFSPFSTFNDVQPYEVAEVQETYIHLAKELNKLEIAYIHISKNPNIPKEVLDAIRSSFAGTIILCNGLTPESAEEALNDNFADITAFASLFIANPDLDKRIEKNRALDQADPNTFYSADAVGYTDYATL
jgi:N-ethylmaleimide reductase